MAPTLNAIGLVVADLAASLAFYRQLGLEFAGDPGSSHLECELAPGMKLTVLDPDGNGVDLYAAR